MRYFLEHRVKNSGIQFFRPLSLTSRIFENYETPCEPESLVKLEGSDFYVASRHVHCRTVTSPIARKRNSDISIECPSKQKMDSRREIEKKSHVCMATQNIKKNNGIMVATAKRPRTHTESIILIPIPHKHLEHNVHADSDTRT